MAEGLGRRSEMGDGCPEWNGGSARDKMELCRHNDENPRKERKGAAK